MIVGKNINYLRRKNNLTQEELAAKIFVSRQAVSKWENGEVVPDSLNLMELSKLFNVKVDDLLMIDLEDEDLNENAVETKSEETPTKLKNRLKLPIIIGIALLLIIVTIYLNKETLFPIKEIDNEQEETNEETNEETVEETDYSKLLSAGRYFSVVIDSTGKIKGYGDNSYHQLDFNDWNDVTEIAAGGFHTLGLKSDGTVLATGYNNSGQIDVSSWSDITQVAAGRYHSLGLKADGTVVAVGNNDKGQLDIATWKDVVAIAGGRYHTIGLKKDNTFLTIGLDDTNQSTNNSNTSSSDPVKHQFHQVKLSTIILDMKGNQHI